MAAFTRSSSLLALFFTLGFGCADSYDEGWGAGDVVGGKADGLADLAVPLEIGQTVSGTVDSQSMVLYRLRLHTGDRIVGREKVTSGDLSPHFSLFIGVERLFRSDTFDVGPAHLDKSYTIEESGTYFVSVRAFENRGSGSFDFVIECTGGPCAGEFADEPLSNDQAGDCIERARACAFDEMGRFNGAVGSTRARQLFEGCLDKLTSRGASCAQACRPGLAGDDSPEKVCEEVIDALPLFADFDTPACIGALDECLAECAALAGSSPTLFSDLAFARCWTFGLNGSCRGYASELEACGGAVDPTSSEECHLFCEATDGAWTADVSGLCSDRCD